MHAVVERIWIEESRRVLATLVRLLGDFDLAEEALHDAFAAALQQWPAEGVPARPRPWLVSAGRFRAIDAMRRRARFDASMRELHERRGGGVAWPPPADDDGIEDDTLRLVFTCCHPDLPPEARIALTLREVCGLTTEEIARAFLVRPSTVAQRIVRARSRLRESRIPFEVPPREALADRLDGVLHVLYLVFNEGYSPGAGDGATRPDLSAEAVRLGRLLLDLVDDPEARGLLGLMLLLEARRAARTDAAGEPVPLENQDRTLWDGERIAEGVALVESALRSRRFGPYTLQGAIAAVHAEAADVASTDWEQIVGLYDVLLRAAPSPVGALGRAVAVAMRDGPEPGLVLIENLITEGELSEYVPAHIARADLLRRAGRREEASASYGEALRRARQEPERRFLERRLRELEG